MKITETQLCCCISAWQRVIELSVEGRTLRATNRALLLLWFFCSLESRSEACACRTRFIELKSLFVTPFSTKWINLLFRWRKNTRAFDCFCQSGWNQYIPPLKSGTRKRNLKPQMGITPLPMFGAKRKWKPLKRDIPTSSKPGRRPRGRRTRPRRHGTRTTPFCAKI